MQSKAPVERRSGPIYDFLRSDREENHTFQIIPVSYSEGHKGGYTGLSWLQKNLNNPEVAFCSDFGCWLFKIGSIEFKFDDATWKFDMSSFQIYKKI